MRVRVYPGPFCKADVLDDDGYLYLDEGATLNDVFKLLKFPFPLRMMKLCTVNYEVVKMTTKLKDGDVISFFAPLAGG